MSRWKTLEEDGERQYVTSRRVTYTHDVQPKQTTTLPPAKKQPKHQSNWLTPIGCGAVIVLGVVCIWTFVIVPTYQHIADQWVYGVSHVAEADATINGHVERFISFDDKGHITIIEVPDNHPEKSRIYQAAQMVGDESNNRIVTVTFKDMNNDGKVDLVVSVEGEAGYIVLFQTATGFTWQQ